MAVIAGIRQKMKDRLPEPIAMEHGRPARFRLVQGVLWSAVVAVLAAGFIAGIYFNLTQVRWGPFYLKPSWDGLFSSPLWGDFRHAYRDQGEPLMAFLIVGTLIAKRKTWSKRAGPVRMVISPLLLTVLSAFGITGMAWVLFVEAPKLAGVAVLNHYILLAGTVAGGFIVGHSVRWLWTPVGSTINGAIIDRSVDRYCLRKLAWLRDASARTPRPPFWVRHWFSAPLFMRERWVWQMEHNDEITNRRSLPRWITRPAVALAVLLVAYLTVTGLIAHFWIGSGHDFPFLAPAGS